MVVLKRYNPARLGGYPAAMVETEEGAWVRWADVERLLEVGALPHARYAQDMEERIAGTEVWAIEDAGITHRYIANGEEEAREIHRGVQPIDVEERWVVRRVP